MEEVLKLTGLTKSYGSLTALRDMNLALPAGKIIGLLGPNGSGKTTLIKLVAGLLTPTEGQILVAGHPVGDESKKCLSYLPERNCLDNRMTPRQVIGYFTDFFPDFNATQAEEMLGRLSVPLDMPVRNLSKGNKEKVQLIMVMCRRVPLYLLDEPIGGVDPATRDYILQTILNGRTEGSTVLISTHLIADVETVLDEFIFIRGGRLTRYGSAELTRQEEGKSLDALFREVFRC